jgi:hypothetical protein
MLPFCFGFNIGTLLFIYILKSITKELLEYQKDQAEIDGKNKLLSQLNHEQRAQIYGIESVVELTINKFIGEPLEEFVKEQMNSIRRINKFNQNKLDNFIDYNDMEQEKFQLN